MEKNPPVLFLLSWFIKKEMKKGSSLGATPPKPWIILSEI